MTVELMTVISVFSIGIGILGSIVGLRRNKSHDDKAEASEITTVIVKLENISKDLVEIKQEFRNEIKTIKIEAAASHDDIIRIDASLKSAWNAINEIKGYTRMYGKKEEDNR